MVRLDYSKSQTTISSFVIDNIPNASITDDQYAIEETHPLLEKYLGPECSKPAGGINV
jgi:hypothetical protein